MHYAIEMNTFFLPKMFEKYSIKLQYWLMRHRERMSETDSLYQNVGLKYFSSSQSHVRNFFLQFDVQLLCNCIETVIVMKKVCVVVQTFCPPSLLCLHSIKSNCFYSLTLLVQGGTMYPHFFQMPIFSRRKWSVGLEFLDIS